MHISGDRSENAGEPATIREPGDRLVSRRDFRGYGDRPPDPRWPGDSRLAVSVVVNVEEGAELSLADGDERNEFVHEVVEEVVGAPDLCMESHFEYGMRAGYWRIAELLDRFGVKATFSASAAPWNARPGSPATSARAATRSARTPIAGTACPSRRSRRAGGDRTGRGSDRGGRGGASRRVAYPIVALGQHAAPVGRGRWFLYDWTPTTTTCLTSSTSRAAPTSCCPTPSIPTTCASPGRAGSCKATISRAIALAAFDWLYKEGARTPKMMSLGLHLRIIGRPGRIAGLEAVLERIHAKDGVWFARREEIAHHWRTCLGLEPFAGRS